MIRKLSMLRSPPHSYGPTVNDHIRHASSCVQLDPTSGKDVRFSVSAILVCEKNCQLISEPQQKAADLEKVLD